MARPPFGFVIDGAQQRQAFDRIGFSAGGDDFQTGQYFSHVVIDPLTSTAFLRPYCYDAAWFTSNAGNYAKLTYADFGSPANWQSEVMFPGAGAYLSTTSTPGGRTLVTTATYPVNQPFYVAAVVQTNSAVTTLLECGWANAADITSETAIRLYTDGSLEVWRNGVLISLGQVSGYAGPSKTPNGEVMELILLPCRHRELLVLSRSGNGARAIIPDVGEYDAFPKITGSAASSFWIRAYGSAKVQAAPLKFYSSGYICSQHFDMAEAPPIGAALETYSFGYTPGGSLVLGDSSYYGGSTAGTLVASLVKEDGVTAFVPNGVLTRARIKVVLTESVDATPFLYGVSGGFKATYADTNSSESVSFNLETAVQRVHLTVPETGGPEITLDMFGPEQLGIVGLYDHDCKPMRTTLGTTVVHDGITLPVDFVEGLTADSDLATLKADPYIVGLLKEYMFRERMIFDGMLVSDASDCVVRKVLNLVGVPDSLINLEASTITAGDIAPAVCGDFTCIADIGDNAWDFLTRVLQDNLGGWWYGEYPDSTGMIFTLKSPATMNGAASVLTYYQSIADAIAGGVAAGEAWRQVWRTRNAHRIRPESNEILVTGFDPRYNLPVQAIKRDNASIDPTTAPSSRPTNWMGMRKRLGVTNRAVGSQAIASAGATILYDRVTPSRLTMEIEVELPVTDDATGFPVWVSDKITLDGLGEFLVISLSAEVVKDPNPTESDDWMWRPARLVVSNVVGYSNSWQYDNILDWARTNQQRSTIARRNTIPGALSYLRPASVDIL